MLTGIDYSCSTCVDYWITFTVLIRLIPCIFCVLYTVLILSWLHFVRNKLYISVTIICLFGSLCYNWCACRAKQSFQAMELCHRSKRHGIPVASSIYDLSVQPPHIPARNGHHTGNTAPAGTANTGGLMVANLASDNNNLTLAHQLNALNTQVRLCALIVYCK